MRKNLNNQIGLPRASFSNRQTICNHLQKLGAIVNAPSRRIHCRPDLVQLSSEMIPDDSSDDDAENDFPEREDSSRVDNLSGNDKRKGGSATATEIEGLPQTEITNRSIFE